MKNINPDAINLNKVGTGGKQSTRDVRVIMQVRTENAPGRTCDKGETSGPVPVNLKMVDDDGDVIVDSAKAVVCNGGAQQSVRTVTVMGPINCKDSAVPDGESSSFITATGSAPGSADYVENLTINCTE